MIASLVAITIACVYFLSGELVIVSGERGFALPSASEWLSAGWLNFAAALIAGGLAVFMVVLQNKVWNILRSMTGLYITLFAIMQAATPQYLSQFYSGSILAITVATGLYLLFGQYRSSFAGPHVFLVFMMLSALTATQYCFAVYIPAFLICCAQMRIFDARTIVAALIGIITPWWILFGFGLVTPADLHTPDFRSIFATMDFGDMALTLAIAGFSGLVLILSIALNLLKTIAYNARSRAINGAITVMAIFTILGACIDFSNVPAYIPLLNLCAAVQTAHYFSTHRTDRSWIAIAAIIAVYIGFYICQIIL